ncbi:type II toxin-antitoxin system RelE/ParE family toxin [uncultured Brevundimonas sp.]|uniref:type II toxin-antitoxin system RelE/ParE family toxin n=1 Tax=uncultured Brevundimonas sp. TaxID=213418 RepID=UPI0025D10F9B|nr:type II toxin-antitoxin system RelE/ParE family toxin [uncultured Brevundimonas sp.]
MSGPYQVIFTARARVDLLAVRRWLHQPGSGLKARLRSARITRAIVELQFTPFRWPEGDVAGVRERPVEGHRILYRIDEVHDSISVLRVFGPFQDRSDT